jgi:hypothetical protein
LAVEQYCIVIAAFTTHSNICAIFRSTATLFTFWVIFLHIIFLGQILITQKQKGVLNAPGKTGVVKLFGLEVGKVLLLYFRHSGDVKKQFPQMFEKQFPAFVCNLGLNVYNDQLLKDSK